MELIYTKGNTYPPIEAILRKAATGEVIDLSGATVTIEVKDTSDTVVVNSTVAIVDSTAGSVRYTVESSLTATSGRYRAKFHVVTSSGGTAHVPNDEYFRLLITD